MSKLIGVDTNILVYSFNKDSIFYSQVVEFLKIMSEQNTRLVVTWQNINEFYAIVSDKKRFSVDVPSKLILKQVRFFITGELFKLVVPNSSTYKIFNRVVMAKMPRAQKVYDLFLAATLMSNGIYTLVTENVKDFEGIKNFKAIRMDEVRNMVAK